VKNTHDVALSMEHDCTIDHQINVVYSPTIKKVNFALVGHLLQHDRSGIDGIIVKYEHGAVMMKQEQFERIMVTILHVLQTVVTAETDQLMKVFERHVMMEKRTELLDHPAPKVAPKNYQQTPSMERILLVNLLQQ